MKKLFTQFAIAVALLSALASSSLATTIHGYGAPSSDPSLTGAAVVDFESEALGNFTSLTIGGVTFATDGVKTGYISSDYAGGYNSTGRNNLQNGTGGFQTLFFNFASSVSAFAFHFGASNEDWQLEAYDASVNLLDSYLLPQTWWKNDGEYFGIAANGISSARLIQLTHVNDRNADHILLDDFAYAAGTTIPEPATMLLLGSGLIGLGYFVRKRMKK